MEEDANAVVLQDLESGLTDTFRRSLWRLFELWDEVGIVGETRKERLEVVMNYIADLLNEMVSEEQGLKEKLARLIREYLAQIRELEEQLRVTPGPESAAHLELLPLLEKERMLKEKLNHLLDQKETQMRAYNSLRDCESSLCKLLQIPAHAISSGSPIPTEADLEELRQHINMLQVEKAKREKEFFSLREEISKLMEELETSPSTSFEREVIYSGEDEFVLSCENIIAVRDLRAQLQSKRCQIEVQCKELLDRLKILWSILNVSAEEQQSVLLKVTGTNPSTLRLLQQQICDYEVVKMQNMQKVIEKLKMDIMAWSKKCYFSESQMENFDNPPFNNPSEELLNYYDSKLQEIHSFYRGNAAIFQRLEKREELWEKMLEFEKKASDPGRFNNRGGALLQEERERKRLLKMIPKLEKELVTLTEEWADREGKDLLIRGRKVKDYIEDQWQLHEIEKENERLERQKQKALMAQEDKSIMTSRLVTPLKHRLNQGVGTALKLYGKCPRTDSKIIPRCSYTPRGSQQGSAMTPRRSPRFGTTRKMATPLLSSSRVQHRKPTNDSKVFSVPRTRASLRRQCVNNSQYAPSFVGFDTSNLNVKSRLQF